MVLLSMPYHYVLQVSKPVKQKIIRKSRKVAEARHKRTQKIALGLILVPTAQILFDTSG